MKKDSGFVLLNILLGTLLLVGLILIIMKSMSHFHAEEKYRNLGEELAPIVSVLLLQTYSSSSYSSLCNNLLVLVPAGYLQSIAASGFTICTTATVTVSCVNESGVGVTC